MNSEYWKQIEALYHSALEMDEEERADFLAVACAGDEGLRREIVSLLSSAERADSFLEKSVLSLGLSLMGAEVGSLHGQTVGRYKLLELLGHGGMGEVYLAYDPRLNRRVALKLLPNGIGSDPERVRRFEQEARAASAISHPNVAHIYEIGEEQGRRYIAMEHIRGLTLRQLIKRGPVEIGQALDIVIQIATALAAAHEAGVVHRDIKPENVMLRDDGYVKVLDFGLAKLIENRLRALNSEAVPFPSLHTEPELLMGTSDYMSPEQVRRQPANECTDLWSLGVVLYEMLSRRRPFSQCPGEVIVAILEQEPEPLEHLRQGLPAPLLRVVSKALMKRPADRYQSAREMANDLRRVRRLVEAGSAREGRTAEHTLGIRRESSTLTRQSQSPVGDEISRPYGMLARMAGFRASALQSATVATLKRRWRPWQSVVLLALLLGASVLLPFLSSRRPHSLQNEALNLRFSRLNLSGNISDIVLSPDGKYIASVVEEEGKKAINIRELATSSDLRIAPPTEKGYSGLSFSPDSMYVYYLENHVETGALYRVSKLGGGQRKITDNVNTGVTFSPDGQRIAFIRSNKQLNTPDLIIAQADGSSERLLARRTLASSDAFMSDMQRAGPVWSPDGKRLACPTFSLSADRLRNIEVIEIESGASRRLNLQPWHDISRLAWLADGSGLVIAATEAPGAAWQIQLLAYPSGTVRRVTNDPNNYTLISGPLDSSIFLAVNIEEGSSVWKLRVSDAAPPDTLEVIQKKGASEILWDTSGKFIYTVNDGTHTNLWSHDGTSTRQLTFEPDNMKPSESPDGRHLVFVSTRAGAMNIWRTNADGTQPLQLTAGYYEDTPSLTPDGRWVIYRTGDSIEKVAIDGGDPVKLLDKSALCPTVSPDGRLLAFFTNERADSQVWHIEVYDLNTVGLVRRLDLPKATSPFNGLRLTPDNRLRWTPDGRGLTYVSHADGAANVWLQPLMGGKPRQLTHFSDAEIPSFAWSPDGKHLACVRNTKVYVPMLVSLF